MDTRRLSLPAAQTNSVSSRFADLSGQACFTVMAKGVLFLSIIVAQDLRWVKLPDCGCWRTGKQGSRAGQTFLQRFEDMAAPIPPPVTKREMRVTQLSGPSRLQQRMPCCLL